VVIILIAKQLGLGYKTSAKMKLTTEQAAEKLGVSSERVRALIKAGRLPAERFGNIYAIDENDLRLVKDRKPGRPSKMHATRKAKKSNR
jgi:excisionase family DNA binding protein